MNDEIDLAFADAQARIDAGSGTPSDYLVTMLLGKHSSRLLTDAHVGEQSARDREVADAIQKAAAKAYVFALAQQS